MGERRGCTENTYNRRPSNLEGSGQESTCYHFRGKTKKGEVHLRVKGKFSGGFQEGKTGE